MDDRQVARRSFGEELRFNRLEHQFRDGVAATGTADQYIAVRLDQARSIGCADDFHLYCPFEV